MIVAKALILKQIVYKMIVKRINDGKTNYFNTFKMIYLKKNTLCSGQQFYDIVSLQVLFTSSVKSWLNNCSYVL